MIGRIERAAMSFCFALLNARVITFQVRQKRQRISTQLVDLTLGSWKVSKAAALSSKKRIFVLVLREWRALTRSFLPFKIQKPSKTAGMRPMPAGLLKRLITVSRLFRCTRVK